VQGGLCNGLAAGGLVRGCASRRWRRSGGSQGWWWSATSGGRPRLTTTILSTLCPSRRWRAPSSHVPDRLNAPADWTRLPRYTHFTKPDAFGLSIPNAADSSARFRRIALVCWWKRRTIMNLKFIFSRMPGMGKSGICRSSRKWPHVGALVFGSAGRNLR
jgi:hypothetical protein